MHPDLAALRTSYELGGLTESDLAEDPLTMFARWFDEASAGGIHEPNAMVLSTAAAFAGPSSRTVLLKGLSASGFVFYSNELSRKGVEMAANPLCALLFPWYELQRQVRIEGLATLVDRATSEEYFASRPRESQLGAWASAQSSVVSSRSELESSYASVEERFAGVEVPCPPHWGGYRVAPDLVEFWQGRRSRMHDRLVYERTPAGWRTSRLAP